HRAAANVEEPGDRHGVVRQRDAEQDRMHDGPPYAWLWASASTELPEGRGVAATFHRRGGRLRLLKVHGFRGFASSSAPVAATMAACSSASDGMRLGRSALS